MRTTGYGLFVEFGRTMAKGALRRSGKLRPDAPYVTPSPKRQRNAAHANNGSLSDGKPVQTAPL